MGTEIEPLPSGLNPKDWLHAVVKGGLAGVPIVGGVASEAFGLLLSPSLQRRRDEWFQQLADGLAEVRAKVDKFDLERLAEDEMFVTSVVNATQAADRTHSDEKILALRNAVLHATFDTNLDEHVKIVFLRLVDELTELHFRLLTYVADPQGWFERHGIEKISQYMGPRINALYAALPEFAGQPDLVRQLAHDLNVRGLADDHGLTGMVSESATYDALASDLGRRFVLFISSE